MTNVNPNLRTFSDMYKSGFQPLFVPLPGSAAPQYSPQGGPSMQPQAGQDTVEIGGKKKMSKGKKAALAGLALAATVAVAATAIHFLGKGTPPDVKKAAKAAQGLLGEAETTVSEVEKLINSAADDVTKAQSSGVEEIKAAKDAAKGALEAVKEKVDTAVKLFHNDGKNEAGDVVAKFFDKEGAEITDVAGRMADGVTMKYASPTAAEELVNAVFNSGSLDSITETAQDGKVLRNIFKTDDGFIFERGIEKLEDGIKNVAEKFVFRGSLENAEKASLGKYFQNTVENAQGLLSSEKVFVFDSNSFVVTVNEGVNYLDEEGVPNQIVNRVIGYNGADDDLKAVSILDDYNLNEDVASRFVDVEEDGALKAIRTHELSDDASELVECNLAFAEKSIPATFAKTTRTEEGVSSGLIIYDNGEMGSYRVTSTMADPEDASKQISNALQLEFSDNGSLSRFITENDKMDGSIPLKTTLDFTEGVPSGYIEAAGDDIHKNFSIDTESGKWKDLLAAENQEGAASGTETN